MAPPRKHQTDTILDAARELAVEGGPRAVSIAAISKVSGAPVGTLYQRFGNRDGILAAAWLRALSRYQNLAITADEQHSGDPIEAGVAIASSAIRFAQAHANDALLLVTVRRNDLLDHAPDGALQARLAEMNAPLEAAARRIARSLYGRANARAIEAVTRALVDVPTSALRRHLKNGDGALPTWLSADVAAAARSLLSAAQGASATVSTS